MQNIAFCMAALTAVTEKGRYAIELQELAADFYSSRGVALLQADQQCAGLCDPHAVEPVCCLGPADLIAFEQCVLVEQAVDLRQQCSALARGGMLYFKLVQVLFLFCVFNRRPGGGWADAAGGSQQDYGSQNKSAQHGNSLSS